MISTSCFPVSVVITILPPFELTYSRLLVNMPLSFLFKFPCVLFSFCLAHVFQLLKPFKIFQCA